MYQVCLPVYANVRQVKAFFCGSFSLHQNDKPLKEKIPTCAYMQIDFPQLSITHAKLDWKGHHAAG